MRVAYHTAGATLSAVELQAWIDVSIADFYGVVAPGELVRVSDPKYPFYFNTDIEAEDRVSLGGKPWSRVTATVRRGSWAFQTVSPEEKLIWDALHTATLGGRIPFVIEIPFSYEIVAVTGNWRRSGLLSAYRRYEVPTMELTEWQP